MPSIDATNAGFHIYPLKFSTFRIFDSAAYKSYKHHNQSQKRKYAYVWKIKINFLACSMYLYRICELVSRSEAKQTQNLNPIYSNTYIHLNAHTNQMLCIEIYFSKHPRKYSTRN